MQHSIVCFAVLGLCFDGEMMPWHCTGTNSRIMPAILTSISSWASTTCPRTPTYETPSASTPFAITSYLSYLLALTCLPTPTHLLNLIWSLVVYNISSTNPDFALRTWSTRTKSARTDSTSLSTTQRHDSDLQFWSCESLSFSKPA